MKLYLQFFGGRGASSASSSNTPRRTQTEHMEQWHEPPPRGVQLANANGISIEDGYNQADAVRSYTGAGYRNIREAQYNNNTSSPYYQEAQFIEDFIAQSPVWAGGELYRGMSLPNEALANIVVGGRIDMRGMSSWTSDTTTAEAFSTHGLGNNKVIFRTKGTKKGASITHLSHFGKGESEVLVSGKATWTVKAISHSRGKTYIDVEED